MADFFIEVIFGGLDIDDDAQIDALTDAGVMTAEPMDAGLVRMSAVVEHANAVDAALEFIESVVTAVPSATAIRAERDLVSVTDIAHRVGLTREAVRHWSSGKRRSGEFPAPVGSPSGSKIWEWSSVHSWLRTNLGIWDELELPAHADFSKLDHLLQQRAQERPAANLRVPARSQWIMVELTAASSAVVAKAGRTRSMTTFRRSERKMVTEDFQLVA